ncbi:NAD(P)H:quinone oxidoreductase, type IV [Marispirochaeta aestuarii]|uniref:NAD(P)H:quinone oxidoreductase, type IV n=1 Tax=Marispirochaeta aestuarii TaxID=1963862 RepID=A0A1Y1S0R2_9SPIO|nr:NAD(P)H:quinone oxidoreductase [Marispirochaeta aestuarii]ORC36955.1 NAD(P)H:quinone oxidoreductase, type IV [Marispirochaeta aestuarii]
MKVNILFYSMYGHMFQMVKAAKEGADKVTGVESRILRIPETLPENILEAMGALEAQKQFADIPEATMDDLAEADGLILGIPTRYGRMSAQWANFLDQSGQLWLKGTLIDKPVALMSSSATQHGGQESTLISTAASLMHHGMLVVGLPYSYQGQMGVDEITGGSPYGASTITGGQGERLPSERELEGARFQGERLAMIASRLSTK